MRNIKNKIARSFFKIFGKNSRGMQLCMKHGLTSGKMLDYIYRNQPQGTGFFGKKFDQFFLNHPGWEGVRIRRENLEYLLEEAIQNLRDQKREISLLDIASGPASYILAVLNRVGEKGIITRCQDFDERWLKEGDEAAKASGFKNVLFQEGDAFDREVLKGIVPRPNMVVSSGFYDWIEDDKRVIDSLKIIFDVLEEGGYLVVTNQMDHPNLELVEEVFSDFNKKPLKMKMRPKELVEQWLKEIGFVVEETISDTEGFYSVTKALKPRR